MTTFNETLHDLLDTPFIRKVYHYPFRDVARLEVFLISHVPLAVVLKERVRKTCAAHKNGRGTVDSVLSSPNLIPRDGSLRAGICIGRALISAFNPDLGKLPAHSTLGCMRLA